MTKAERENGPRKIFFEKFGSCAILRGIRKEKIPHADLIQAAINASAVVAFGLDISFSTEGGVEGFYNNDWIEISNLADDDFGFYDELSSVPLTKGKNKVLRFYERFMDKMFTEDGGVLLKDPDYQTTEAVWNKLSKVMQDLGGKNLSSQVVAWLTNHDFGRTFPRGLTDEEIIQHFVPPHLE